jgi:hypothetical protein
MSTTKAQCSSEARPSPTPPNASSPHPPHTIRIKRPRDEAPVTSICTSAFFLTHSDPLETLLSFTDAPLIDLGETDIKRVKTSNSKPSNPAYVFRLAHTITAGGAFQPVTTRIPVLREGTEYVNSPVDESPITALSAPTTRPHASLQASILTPTTTNALTENNTEKSAKLKLDTTKNATDPSMQNAARQSTFGEKPPLPSSLTPHERIPPEFARKRKIAPVRKYQLSKRVRTKYPHPYASGVRISTAVFERVKDDEEMPDSEANVADNTIPPSEEPKKEHKRPRTHPMEKAQIKEAREQGTKLPPVVLGIEQDERLMKEMEKMVLEYLDQDSNAGMRNLPPTPVETKPDLVGGGVGGGTWDDHQSKDVEMADEDEQGFVYDVYFREEVTMDTIPVTIQGGKAEEEPIGILVFNESEDETWWYEGAGTEEDDSDVYASDDEDSNGLFFRASQPPLNLQLTLIVSRGLRYQRLS